MKKIITKSLIIITLITLSSCVSLPSHEEMKAEIKGYSLPVLGKKDSALVYVMRPSGLGFIVRFNVFLDGKEDADEMGNNRGVSYIYFHVTPGQHKIFSKAENWAQVDINPKAGEVVFIKQNPEPGLLMARNNIEILDDVEAKYYLKKLSLGSVYKTEK
jgi:hypothetical protein